MSHPCFMLEPIGQIRVWARRYSDSVPDCCPRYPGQYSYHNAMNLIGDFELEHKAGEYEEWADFLETIRPPADSPIWPQMCICGSAFSDSHIQRGGQMFAHRLHRRSDNGELTTIQEAPAGAMWWAWWMKAKDQANYNWYWDNQTEAPLIVKTPGGEWNVDGRASNCTLPNERTHRCWIRHGTPPQITVDKNGATCAAGAGSILCGNYHGFLRNGELT